jgi:glycine betaine/proline transport system substrate-binding protein
LSVKKLALAVSSVALAGAAITGCGASNSQNTSNATGGAKASKNITIGWLGWTEDVAITYLWKQILENKGYHVSLKELDPGPLFLGLSNPNNLDFFMDTWIPSDSIFVNKYKAKLKDLGVWYTGSSSQGIAVPQYMKNVNTPQDLQKYASEFGNTVVGIEAGSEEMTAAQKWLQDYGVTNMHLQSSSTTAMLTSLERAYQQHKPVAVVMWTPHWAFTKYHLKYIKDPDKILASDDSIHIEANGNWANANPQVTKWLQNFKLNATQLSALEEDVNAASDKQQGANKWLQQNQSLVNSWLK